MAHHKSAKKRIRTNSRRRDINRSYISSVRTAVKKFKEAATAGTDKGSINDLFSSAQALLAKAATKGIIHKNNASRHVGRLAAMLKLAHEKTPVVAKKKEGASKKVAAKAKPKKTTKK